MINDTYIIILLPNVMMLESKYEIVKTSIELTSMLDLVRLSVFAFKKLRIRYPFLLATKREGAWVYFIKFSHHLPEIQPLMVTYYYKSKKKHGKPYIEYIAEKREKMRYITVEEMTNPAIDYVGLYEVSKTSITAHPFKEDEQKGVKYVDEIKLDSLEFIEIEEFSELVRIASDTENIIFSIKKSDDEYIYLTGFPFPVINASVGDFALTTILYAKGPKPVVQDKIAGFVKYVEKTETEEQTIFQLGVDILGRTVPIVHVKRFPFLFY